MVADLIVEAREAGAAIVGIFHDEDTRERVATRVVGLDELTKQSPSNTGILQTC